MKYFILSVVIAFTTLSAVWFALGGGERAASNLVSADANIALTDMKDKRPILVELFTSEGCSSCPPADRLLTDLKGNDNVITLSFHVDYWNYLGWKDPFSSAEFSRRQEQYARRFKLDSSYTPQMVVNGSAEFVGSNRSKANDVIGSVPSEPTGAIYLTLSGGRLTADISELSKHADATVYLAIAESGLVTKVRSGENAGSTLEHSSVVRQLIAIGKVKAGEKGLKIERDIPRNGEWKGENVKYVVFVQENENLKVLAVGAIR